MQTLIQLHDHMRDWCKGTIGMIGSAVGFFCSAAPQLETWFRLTSGFFGVCIGLLTTYSLILSIRRKRQENLMAGLQEEMALCHACIAGDPPAHCPFPEPKHPRCPNFKHVNPKSKHGSKLHRLFFHCGIALLVLVMFGGCTVTHNRKPPLPPALAKIRQARPAIVRAAPVKPTTNTVTLTWDFAPDDRFTGLKTATLFPGVGQAPKLQTNYFAVECRTNLTTAPWTVLAVTNRPPARVNLVNRQQAYFRLNSYYQ